MFKRLFNRTPASYKVSVEPFGKTFVVGSRETVLRGALNAGLAYPFECQTGACSTCKSQLIEGEIKALTDFAYVLDIDEIKNGAFLACQTLAKSDLKIVVKSLDDGMPAILPEHRIGKIKSVLYLTRDIIEVQIAVAEPITYYAGQYANIGVPETDLVRSYSFATPAKTSTEKNELAFHIKIIEKGQLSDWFRTIDRVGESLTIDGPYGIFRIRHDETPIVFIAGGSGMSPIKAIIEESYGTGSKRPAVYLYGAKTQADLYPQEVITHLLDSWPGNLRFMPVLSHEPENSSWTGARGLVTDFINDIHEFKLGEAQSYLCGPPEMIDTAVSVLTGSGMRGKDIFFDKFVPSSPDSNPG